MILGRNSTRFPLQSSFYNRCRGRAGEGEVSRAAWRPVRTEAAARRNNQAWAKAKATTAQDSAARVSEDSVAQSMQVRGGQEQCSGLVQEAGAQHAREMKCARCCDGYPGRGVGGGGHQSEREKSNSPGPGKAGRED